MTNSKFQQMKSQTVENTGENKLKKKKKWRSINLDRHYEHVPPLLPNRYPIPRRHD